jgi:tetratricopeptide (TPR) repeat protein
MGAEKHFEKAYRGYCDAIALNPNQPLYYTNRAMCSMRLEKLEDAVHDATIAIGLDSKCAKVRARPLVGHCSCCLNYLFNSHKTILISYCIKQ